MDRRFTALIGSACLAVTLLVAACGSDAKEKAPTAPTSQTTVTASTTTGGFTTTTEADTTEPSREGGAGKSNGNSNSGNVGGDTGGPDPGANNYGG